MSRRKRDHGRVGQMRAMREAQAQGSAAFDEPTSNGRPNLPATLSVANATLPATYERAKNALAECHRVDECKDWSDKAAALASYAKQADDKTLYKLAVRIQSRAIRRAMGATCYEHAAELRRFKFLASRERGCMNNPTDRARELKAAIVHLYGVVEHLIGAGATDSQQLELGEMYRTAEA